MLVVVMKEKIKVVELFAGVGGFRIGLEGWEGKSASSGYKKRFKSQYETVWSSQWEPGVKSQPASKIYVERFSESGHSNDDIAEVIEHNFKSIPDHHLLVGGFPCQDYSVARTLSHAEGLEGKKGVLWWSIHDILKKKGSKAPNYLMLENVDRLLKSPAGQRGRDFAIMLASLSDLGYAVEWRVINAAEYGMPQRRRRVYILGYKKGTKPYQMILKNKNKQEIITKESVIAKAFPVEDTTAEPNVVPLEGLLEDMSTNFSSNAPKLSPFLNGGVMIKRKAYTLKVVPKYSGNYGVLNDFLVPDKDVSESFYIPDDEIPKWEKHKGGKNETRVTKSGFEYNYTEGSMAFPDPRDKPSRTIVTGEGGRSPSRFKHVIKTKSGYRRLTPLELERLNMFPDDHTLLEGVSDTKRAFIMGNALVIGVIEKLGKALSDEM